MRVLSVLLLGLWAITATAEVYRYVDAQGVVHYTDKPPRPDAKPAALPPLQTMGGYGTPAAAGAPATAEAAAPAAAPREPRYGLKILSPVADATLRNDSAGEVAVSVAVSPRLAEGYRVQYTVDGSRVGEPGGTQATLGPLERGSHLIGALLLDADGREVARASPVIVHLKIENARPPSAQPARPVAPQKPVTLPAAPRSGPPG